MLLVILMFCSVSTLEFTKRKHNIISRSLSVRSLVLGMFAIFAGAYCTLKLSHACYDFFFVVFWQLNGLRDFVGEYDEQASNVNEKRKESELERAAVKAL